MSKWNAAILSFLVASFAFTPKANAESFGYSPFGDQHWRYPVTSVAALPLVGNLIGDARAELTDFSIYIWTGSAWVNSAAGAGFVTTVTATSPIVSSGGGAPNISCLVASGSQAGCLSAADFSSFSSKQPAGNYITSLTGPVTASGPGAAATTITPLAITNSMIANGTLSLTTKVTGILPVANGGTNSGTALGNGQVLVSNSGQIVENPNIYSVYNGGLSIGAPLSNPNLEGTSFGVYEASTTTSTSFEYPMNFFYELTPASTQTGDYGSFIGEIALNASSNATALNGFYYASYFDAAAQVGTLGGPLMAGLDYTHFDNAASGILSLGREVTVVNDGTGQVNNSWGISIDTVQATGVGSNPHRGALLMLGDHTFLGSHDGCEASGSTVSNECNAIYVRAGALNATGTNASNWVIHSLDTSPSSFAGSIAASGFTGPLTGNASTATALATTPTQCSGSQFSTGIAANGNANCSTPSAGSGTVTSVALTAPSFLSVSGSPITTSGTLALSLSGTPLPTANGGTGQDFSASNGAISVSGGSMNAGTLSVAYGGTSVTSLPLNNVVVGGGSGSPIFVAPGTSGNLLTSNGTGWISSAPAAPTFTAPTQQILTSSGTYMRPTHAPLYITVEISGSGGGGEGAGTTQPGGSNGATSSFGSLVSCPGGTGNVGNINAPGGTPCTISSPAYGKTFAGGDGQGGQTTNGVGISQQLAGGMGGASYLGGAGSGGGINTAGTAGVTGTGAGGGGGNTAGTPLSQTGGGGGAGAYAFIFVPSPSSTYSVTLPAGGAGGAGGTGGTPGGDGARPQATVTEYYQ